jgi:glycosyl transferase family 2
MNTQPFSYWLIRNRYYHQQLLNFYRFSVQPGKRVLQLDGKNGYVLDAIKPSYGVVVEGDMQARHEGKKCYPALRFIASLEELQPQEPFDYIIVSSSIMEAYDIQMLFEKLQPWCSPTTRIVIDTYSHVWEPILWLTQKLGFRRPTTLKNWISHQDLLTFLHLANFEQITAGSHILMPIYIPLLSWVSNKILAWIPGISMLCLHRWTIARIKPIPGHALDYGVSVVIPCRNERGNIEAAITRTPSMGAYTEFIFVEGHSRDNTLQEIKRVAAVYSLKNIRYFVQTGTGKGDAMRLGFANATGDILIILDADLTTPPEEMPKFFDALINGKGDFINGSRLVYGMEDQAMRFLNLLANHFFSLLFTWLLGQKIKDTLCGTKVFFKRDYEEIVNNRAYFGDFDPFGDFDLLFGAAKLNLKITDMPIHYKNRSYGSTQIKRFRAGWLLLGMSCVALKKFKIR